MPTTRYAYLDILKAICAFMVVFLHAGTTGAAGSFFMVVCRVAVPFFFMVTGFFLGKKREKADPNHVYMPMIKKTGKLFIMTSLFYVACVMILWLVFGQTFSASPKLPAPTVFWFNFLVYNESPFAPHLWYLGAAFYALIILFFIEKSRYASWFIMVLPNLLILSLALGVYAPLLLGNSCSLLLSRNSLMTALPCICLGYGLATIENDLKGYASYAFPCAIACALASMMERFILRKSGCLGNGDVFLFTIPTAVCMFVWAISRKSPLPSWLKLMETIGQRHSANIYVYHFLFVFLWNAMLSNIILIRPWAIFAISLLFSVGLDRFRGHFMKQKQP